MENEPQNVYVVNFPQKSNFKQSAIDAVATAAIGGVMTVITGLILKKLESRNKKAAVVEVPAAKSTGK